MSLVTISLLSQAAGVKLSARTSASRRFCGPHTPRESGSQERHKAGHGDLRAIPSLTPQLCLEAP